MGTLKMHEQGNLSEWLGERLEIFWALPAQVRVLQLSLFFADILDYNLA